MHPFLGDAMGEASIGCREGKCLARFVFCRAIAGDICLLSIAELTKEGPEVVRKPALTMPATSL